MSEQELKPLSCPGVGPHPRPWPRGSWYDPRLLEAGDSRNVVDKYRYWRMESIVEDLAKRRHDFHVAVENWQHDMNIGSIVRCANAFGARAVHIIGRKRWNRRGAMVTDRYQEVLHHESLESFVSSLAGLPIVGVDNLKNSVAIEGFSLPKACVMLFGQEGPGLSQTAINLCQSVVEITQFGSTRSINAAAAAAIAMHAWIRQYAI